MTSNDNPDQERLGWPCEGWRREPVDLITPASPQALRRPTDNKERTAC